MHDGPHDGFRAHRHPRDVGHAQAHDAYAAHSHDESDAHSQDAAHAHSQAAAHAHSQAAAHAHSHDESHAHPHDQAQPRTRPGHNAARDAMQWQTPHLPADQVASPDTPEERDLDLVEASFVEGFVRCSDATSFLRLAGIPFVGVDADGRRLSLLRVEIEDMTDVGSVVPLLDGAGMRYDPLPEKFVSRRRRLTFAYHDGTHLVRLPFPNARALAT